jgi:hypothetical protein
MTRHPNLGMTYFDGISRSALRSAFSTYILPVVLILLGEASTFSQNSVYELAAKPQKAEVSILAISSSVHSGASGNQEIYLADIRLKGNTHQMAKLVDTYSSISMPIQRAVLADRHLLHMTLIRDQECDATGQSFFLAPGDHNIFDASTRSVLNDQAAERIPCFNVIHDATRLAK